MAGSHSRTERPGSQVAALEMGTRTDSSSSTSSLGRAARGKRSVAPTGVSWRGKTEENGEHWREQVEMAGGAVGAVELGVGGAAAHTGEGRGGCFGASIRWRSLF